MNFSETNNATMKTVVETFVIEETQELIYDGEKLDQWNSLVAELGLQGQTQIVAPTKSPIPYLFMNASMVRVFEILCPRKVDIAAYNKTPIPVEILRLVSLSKSELHFDAIQIWYDDETPDPACIGLKLEYYSYDSSYRRIRTYESENEMNKDSDPNVYRKASNVIGNYLIGRWGDVKMSIDKLTEKAKMLFKAKRTDELNKRIVDAQRELLDLDIKTNENFGHVLPSTDMPF